MDEPNFTKSKVANATLRMILLQEQAKAPLKAVVYLFITRIQRPPAALQEIPSGIDLPQTTTEAPAYVRKKLDDEARRVKERTRKAMER